MSSLGEQTDQWYSSEYALEQELSRIDELRQTYEAYEWPVIPDAEVTFYFHWHARGADINVPGLRKLVKTHDVIVPEAYGWRPKDLERDQKVSKGKVHARSENDPEHIAARERGLFMDVADPVHMDNVLFATKKRIIFVDVPLGSDIDKEDRKLQLRNKFTMGLNGLKGIIDYTRLTRAEYARQHLERELLILDNLSQATGLEGKRVLVILGADHTLVEEPLRRSGQPVNRVFWPVPFAYDYYSETSRRFMRGLPVDDDLCARTHLSDTFSHEFNMYTQTSNETAQLMRSCLGDFARDDLAEILQPDRVALDAFTAMLKERCEQFRNS